MDYSLLTKEKISQKYDSSTRELRDALSSAQTLIAVENIAAKYRLDEEKTTMLIQLVGLVILGFANFNDMKEEMKETIEIDSKFIPLITDEIRQKIFLPIINSLQKTPAAPKTTTPAPPYQGGEKGEVSSPSSRIDRYRELAETPAAPVMPRIVDLRKPPAPQPPKAGPPLAEMYTPMPVEPETPPSPVAPTPLQPKPAPQVQVVPMPIRPAPITPAPTTPLIEAEPHELLMDKPKITTPTPPYQGGEAGEVASPAPAAPLPTLKPQYIMRPPGAPPTNSPYEVLDLRRDKGEF